MSRPTHRLLKRTPQELPQPRLLPWRRHLYRPCLQVTHSFRLYSLSGSGGGQREGEYHAAARAAGLCLSVFRETVIINKFGNPGVEACERCVQTHRNTVCQQVHVEYDNAIEKPILSQTLCCKPQAYERPCLYASAAVLPSASFTEESLSTMAWLQAYKSPLWAWSSRRPRRPQSG
jgi:hypothetical protein